MICSPGDFELPDFVLLVAELHLNVSVSACYDLRQCFGSPVLDNTLASSDKLLDQGQLLTSSPGITTPSFSVLSH